MACAALLGCEGSLSGTYKGKTSILIASTVSDEHPYKETRSDSVVIKDDGDLSIAWLGCSFHAPDHGNDTTDLKPDKCDIELHDGRVVKLSVGLPKNPQSVGTTLATIFPADHYDPLSIRMAGGVTIAGMFYSPAMFDFEADEP